MRFYTNAQLSGNNICVREVDKNGNRKKYRVPFSPKLYTPTNKKTNFHTLSGQNLEEISFESIRDANEFIKQYDGVSNFEIYGNTMYQYSWITESFPGNIEADPNKMSIVSLDIEVHSKDGFPEPTIAKDPVISFVIKQWSTGQRYVCAVNPDSMGTPYDPTTRNIPGKINYMECKNEDELLDAFAHIWNKLQPDIITGWAIKTFDIPYLVNRYRVLRGEDAANFLSPWKYIKKTSVKWLNQEVPTYDISGVSNLDYMFIYKKNTFTPRENWKLDYISTVELGEGKVAYEGSIQDFYETDFHSFVDYNIQDVDLIDKLDEKLKLISVVMDVAYYAKVNYEDVLSQTKVWDMKINNVLLERNCVIPQRKHNVKGEKYEGAYVKVPNPGLYKWVISFDFASLYPNLIRTFNIGMETKYDFISGIDQHTMLEESNYIFNVMQDSKHKDLTLSANGVRYNRSQISLYSQLLAEVFDNRIAFKKRAKVAKSKIEALKSDQQTPKILQEIEDLGFEVSYCTVKDKVMKVLMNSLYGAIGCEYFRHYDVQNAEAVTISGQYVLKYVERAINVHLNKIFNTKNVDYVVYCDTDSVYINLESLVEKMGLSDKPVEKVIDFLDKVCKSELQNFIDKTCLDLINNKVNGIGDNLKMVRDVLTDVSIWTAKKRYIMNVYDSEGVRYEKPQMKMMGIEAIKSSTPGPCRKKLEEAIKIIISGDKKKLVNFVQEFKQEFKTLDHKAIGIPTGVNGIEDYPMINGQFMIKTPWHVKASLAHNMLIEKNSLKIKPIKSGEKIKVMFLKTPNPSCSSSVAFVGNLPKEFKIDGFIDYDTQFDKSFLGPLKLITDAINWNTENSNSLEAFFE